MRLQGLLDRLGQVEPRIDIVIGACPAAQGHIDGVVPQTGDLGPGRRIVQDALICLGALDQEPQGRVQIVVVIDAKDEFDASLAGLAHVDDHLAEHLAVGQVEGQSVEIDDRRVEKVEIDHLPVAR